MFTFTTEVPWVPSHHCLSMSMECLTVCLFQHHSPGPNLKNGTVCPRDGFAWPGAQGEQCRKATSESTTAPWTEVFWMRQLSPTNHQFHWNVVSWGYFQLRLVTEPCAQELLCAIAVSSASKNTPLSGLSRHRRYLSAGEPLPAATSQVPVSTPAPPSRAGRTSCNYLLPVPMF